MFPFALSKVKSESEVAQSCPTLCDPMDCCLSGSSVHGIFQARVLEWIAISFSRGYGPDPGIEPWSLALQADALPSEPPGKPSKVERTSKQKNIEDIKDLNNIINHLDLRGIL